MTDQKRIILIRMCRVSTHCIQDPIYDVEDSLIPYCIAKASEA